MAALATTVPFRISRFRVAPPPAPLRHHVRPDAPPRPRAPPPPATHPSVPGRPHLRFHCPKVLPHLGQGLCRVQFGIAQPPFEWRPHNLHDITAALVFSLKVVRPSVAGVGAEVEHGGNRVIRTAHREIRATTTHPPDIQRTPNPC